MVLPQAQGKGQGQRELTAVLTSGGPDGTLENGSPPVGLRSGPKRASLAPSQGGLSGQVDCWMAESGLREPLCSLNLAPSSRPRKVPSFCVRWFLAAPAPWVREPGAAFSLCLPGEPASGWRWRPGGWGAAQCSVACSFLRESLAGRVGPSPSRGPDTSSLADFKLVWGTRIPSLYAVGTCRGDRCQRPQEHSVGCRKVSGK